MRIDSVPKLSLVLILVSLLPNVAGADAMTAETLYEACVSAERMGGGMGESVEEMLTYAGAVGSFNHCAGYIMGFSDGYRYAFDFLAGAANDMKISQGEKSTWTSAVERLKTICLPDKGLTIDRMIEVFKGYIMVHPELKMTTARTALFSAFAQAWPCSK